MKKTVYSLMVFIVLMVGCDSSRYTAINGGPLKVRISWNPSTGSPLGYYIEQSTDNVNFNQILSVVSSTSAKISGVAPGKTYYFRVKAYNINGNSEYTKTVSVTMPK
jgi:hypothetical protein